MFWPAGRGSVMSVETMTPPAAVSVAVTVAGAASENDTVAPSSRPSPSGVTEDGTARTAEMSAGFGAGFGTGVGTGVVVLRPSDPRAGRTPGASIAYE